MYEERDLTLWTTKLEEAKQTVLPENYTILKEHLRDTRDK
jgi:hypothetical protein